MKIGIDIDGTITTPFYFLDFYNKHFNTSIRPKDMKTYDHHKVFNVSSDDFLAFRKRYLNKIHRLALPRNKACTYVNRLFFEGHQLSIITARERLLENLSKEWLLEHNFEYSDIHHLGSYNKVSTAIKLNLDIFIEDRLETAQDMIAWGIPTILFNTPYNQGYYHPSLYRVDTWKEAYTVLQEMMLEKKVIKTFL